MNRDNQNEVTVSGKINWILLGASLLIIGTWLLTWLLLSPWKPEDRGTFGDMFGAANALFSGFALLGVIYAILLQRQELKYQRKELELTRLELKGQKEQLTAQNEIMGIQKFENTFFQLIDLQNKIVERMRYESRHTTYEAGGKQFIYEVYDDVQKGHLPSNKKMNQLTLQRIQKAYSEVYYEQSVQLQPYFRNIENILKLIDRQQIPDDADIYASILRSMLDENELALLAYHSLSEAGNAKLRKLLETYYILQDLPKAKVPKILYNQIVKRHEDETIDLKPLPRIKKF